jgi:hypothetical protein
MPSIGDLPLYHNAEVSIAAWKDKLQDAKTVERRQKCLAKLAKWEAIMAAVKKGYVRPPKPSRPVVTKPPPLPKPPKPVKEKKVKQPKPPKPPKQPKSIRAPAPPRMPSVPVVQPTMWVPAPLRWD